MSRKPEALSENFTSKCVRALDHGFDANDYYRYFLNRGEHFIIRAKKNRNVICNWQTCNIMDVSLRYKGAYHFRFKKQQFEFEDLRVMSSQSIRNLNLLAMLATGYIGLTSSVHEQERHKRLLSEKSKITALNLFEHFKIADVGAFVL